MKDVSNHCFGGKSPDVDRKSKNEAKNRIVRVYIHVFEGLFPMNPPVLDDGETTKS